MDFISGRNYFFRDDDELLDDNFLQNFHLKPSRILHRTSPVDSLAALINTTPVFIFNNKEIVVIDEALNDTDNPEKVEADLIIISKNTPAKLARIAATFKCRQIVFDASNSQRKVNKWKAEAANLGLSCFSVVDNGAFVMKVD